MIPLILLGGLLAGAAIAVAVTFWDQIKKFLQLAFNKVKKVLSAAIIGVATYIETADWRESIKVAYKFYSKDEIGRWQETITTKTISPEEVPENIRRKLEGAHGPIDVSSELELALQ